MRDKILDAIKATLTDICVIDKGEELLGDMIAEDLGMDSLDKAELVMSMEEKFSINLGADDVENVKTVDELITIVENRINATYPNKQEECNCEECTCEGGSSTILPTDETETTEEEPADEAIEEEDTVEETVEEEPTEEPAKEEEPEA